MSISISSYNEIRRRAQEIFKERQATGREGGALSDWLEAEEEIKRVRLGHVRVQWRPAKSLFLLSRAKLHPSIS